MLTRPAVLFGTNVARDGIGGLATSVASSIPAVGQKERGIPTNRPRTLFETHATMANVGLWRMPSRVSGQVNAARVRGLLFVTIANFFGGLIPMRFIACILVLISGVCYGQVQVPDRVSPGELSILPVTAPATANVLVRIVEPVDLRVVEATVNGQRTLIFAAPQGGSVRLWVNVIDFEAKTATSQDISIKVSGGDLAEVTRAALKNIVYPGAYNHGKAIAANFQTIARDAEAGKFTNLSELSKALSRMNMQSINDSSKYKVWAEVLGSLLQSEFEARQIQTPMQAVPALITIGSQISR